MSVEQAIHENWSLYRPLTTLVPITHVYTGTVPRADADGETLSLPWVSLETVGDSQTVRTNSGTTITAAQLRFHVFADTLAAAKEIVEVIMDHFDRAEFNWSRGRVLDMKHENRDDAEEEDGTWHSIVDYTARVTREAGA